MLPKVAFIIEIEDIILISDWKTGINRVLIQYTEKLTLNHNFEILINVYKINFVAFFKYLFPFLFLFCLKMIISISKTESI